MTELRGTSNAAPAPGSDAWFDRLVRAKWSSAPELGRCRSCRGLVLAASIDGAGDCAQCAHNARWEWRRQQLTLGLAA